MSRINNIEWRRIGIEAAAIVGSILLAFWIDAWWDDRNEQRAIQDTLLSLELEIEANLVNLQSVFFNVNESILSIDSALRFLADPEQGQTPDSFYDDIARAYFYFGPDTTAFAFEVVVKPEILRQINDPKLAASIKRAYEDVEDVDQTFAMLQREYNERQAPTLAQLFIVSDFGWYGQVGNQLVSSQIDELREAGVLRATPRPRFTVDEQGVRSKKFWNLLYIWKAQNLDYLIANQTAQKHLRETLDLLQSELRERN